MKRSEFLAGIAGGAFAVSAAEAMPADGPFATTEVEIERAQPGKPHAGKVLAAIQPHADDLSLFAGGLVLKLIQEGYTGYLIRTTNDDHTGPGTVGEGMLANERDNLAVTQAFGLRKAYDLYYRNHMLDGVSPLELRLRLIFLFRLLKVDTVISYDPWGHYEENPDHYVTASAVEAACWMAGMGKDYPEQFDAGLSPHSVKEKYYYARGPQLVNRVVDIADFMDRKIAVNILNAAQGPAGNSGAQLRRRLTGQGLRLPLLGNDDETANREYTRQFVLDRDAETGRKFGLTYAEPYHYIGPAPAKVEGYIKKNAVKL
ncbi:MAG: PIG-L family deacetylase [Candidatus Sulfopaludibacter sp.]|nr:PIG-L family deacetylase [Candidatus Sulfopaludibacter sp.]